MPQYFEQTPPWALLLLLTNPHRYYVCPDDLVTFIRITKMKQIQYLEAYDVYLQLISSNTSVFCLANLVLGHTRVQNLCPLPAHSFKLSSTKLWS